VSGSFASVSEPGHDEGHEAERVRLGNLATRFEGPAGAGSLYTLVEASRNWPTEGSGHWSILGEARFTQGPHQPYVRLERSTRPEFAREATAGDGFFLYDHDSDPVGSSKWLIATVGYGLTVTTGDVSVRPYVEGARLGVERVRGVSAPDLFGGDVAYMVSFGFRVFLGGDPMRMGSYGLLDPMRTMGGAGAEHMHHD